MIGLLFTIVLGSQTYNIVKDCKDMAHVYYPVNDSKENRTLSICFDYGPIENRQLLKHELLHICMHDHKHNFSTKEEMDKHLHNQMYTEEYFATVVAPCLIDNEEKLVRALGDHHEYLSGDG